MNFLSPFKVFFPGIAEGFENGGCDLRKKAYFRT